MSSIKRPVLPAIALLVLGIVLALPNDLSLIPLGSLDTKGFISVLLIFAVLAACVERAVEVLMSLCFSKQSPAEVAYKAARAAVATELAIETQRMDQTAAPQERLAILQSWSSEPLAEKKRIWTVEYQKAKPTRTLWATSFSLLLSAVLAANGLLLISQLIHLSATDPDATLDNQTLRWMDAVVTTFVLAGGAEWFHEQIKRLNPLGANDPLQPVADQK